MQPALLEMRSVYKNYGQTPVIKGLSLLVQQGEFVGVIGPNGAGKTTAFGLLSGDLRCNAGSVWLGGADVTHQRADARCRSGIGRTFQIPRPFGGMTVYENVLVAACFGAGLSAAAAERAAATALMRCGLQSVGNLSADRLGLMQRKRLELARALATEPQVLLLDEVGGGLTEPEVQELLDLVVSIHSEGVTVLWIEHLVHALVSVVKRLVVLTDGVVLADGSPQSVIASRLVRETYLGAELDLEPEAAHV